MKTRLVNNYCIHSSNRLEYYRSLERFNILTSYFIEWIFRNVLMATFIRWTNLNFIEVAFEIAIFIYFSLYLAVTFNDNFFYLLPWFCDSFIFYLSFLLYYNILLIFVIFTVIYIITHYAYFVYYYYCSFPICFMIYFFINIILLILS